ncbi:substrate-binding domain-containing protein [Muriicola sp. Z0-33]|uniref:substrate-binding domain-containing protein n=1 Tax=Muriicola sp. Z0-33 TaxID=2816957 RepID=UPI0022387776|nr:substrate-binding domain-containing protein [Muriicola sp. Z0-33]MCW5515325.1 ABC transporter substrate-binding protein [Muriicola sp. Z0-33]
MKKVRIIGVPEHFNLPWHLAIDEGAFHERGISLQWTDVPEGTGRMCQMLQDNEADLAIILTEGIVKSITEGNPVKIVQEYIGSPLQWGIHVAASSQYNSISSLEGTKAAISRYGSGSHLMAYVNAQNHNWDTDSLKFEVINNLDGAVTALTEDHAQYFMWEHFTTKPLVDKGIFRRLGDCPTPWPCFVIAAREEFISQNTSVLQHILEIINLYSSEFKKIPSIDRTLANSYGLELADVVEWLSITSWSQTNIDSQVIDNVQNTLYHLKLIKDKLSYKEIVWSAATNQ